MKKIFVLIVAILPLLAGCGGGSGGGTAGGGTAPVPAIAVLKLSAQGTPPLGKAVIGFGATIELPTGVTVKTGAGGAVDSTVVVPSGLLAGAGNTTMGPIAYTAATATSKAKLDFTIASTSAAGVGVGEYVTLTFILSDVSPSAADFNVISFKPIDQSYADLTTLTVSKIVSVYIPGNAIVDITPKSATVASSGNKTFTATVTGASNTQVTWSVVETTGGSITSAGVYTAPTTAGTYHVKATSVADTTKSATATVTVSAATPSGVFPIGTWVGPHGASFTVTKLSQTTPGLNYYAGSISFPAFGTVSFSGNPYGQETSQILLGGNFAVNANYMNTSTGSFTFFVFQSDQADDMNIPALTKITGDLIVQSSVPGNTYNETATFIRQ